MLGFTNLLWVLYMSLFHLLPISSAKISAFIQASGGIFLLINLIFVAAICDELFPGRRSLATVAMVLTAFDGPLNNWALQGTEVGILTLGVTASTWLALRTIQTGRRAITLYSLLALMTLCRLDMAVFAGTILVAVATAERSRWKTHLILGGAIVAFFLAAQLGFNFSYYGDALPNTYYLKLTGYPLLERIRRGIFVSFLFLLPLSPIALAAAAYAKLHGIPRRTLLLAAVVVAQLAYSTWVGGDAWEWWGGSNRYVSIAMPLFFILVAPVLVAGSGRVFRRAGRKAGARFSAAVALTAMVGVVLLLVNIYQLRSTLLIDAPPQTSNPHSFDTNEGMVRQALLIDRFTDPGATMAVVWAGSLPYFANRRSIDLLGKTDPKIAMEKTHVGSASAQSKGFWPGHLKWDYDYSIGDLKPDVVVQLWGVAPQSISALKRDYVAVSVEGFHWYLRRGSPQIRWSALKLQAQ